MNKRGKKKSDVLSWHTVKALTLVHQAESFFVTFCSVNTIPVVKILMGYSFSLSVLHRCALELSAIKQLVCSPWEAPALQWSLPCMLCLRGRCARFKLSWQLSALLNWGLGHSWLDAADDIPLKIIALRGYSSLASKFCENVDLHICGAAEYLCQRDQTELWFWTSVACAGSRPPSAAHRPLHWPIFK